MKNLRPPALAAAFAAAALASLPAPAAAQGLPAAALADAQALAQRTAAALAPAGARVEANAGALDPRLHLAPCTRIEPYLPAGSRPWGRTRIGLRCVEGATAWNVFLPMTVKVLAPALVVTTPLPVGAVVESGQLREAEVDWAAEPSPVLRQPAAVLGRTVARALAAGEAVRQADLRARQWFSAGETVQIVASGNGFSISGEGQALSNGVEGQPARVRTDAGRVVSGVPVGERRIEVAL